jgi:hypothetical protein
MSRSSWLLAVPLLLLLAASPIRAGESDEATLEILLGTLQHNKMALVAVNLTLTDEEARAFWPVYDRYQKDLAAIQDRLLAVIGDYAANYGSMNDDEAMQLAEDYLRVERDHAALRQAYLKPISDVLPGMKVMRFYQIENKIDAILRYDLAATIPVVPEEPAPR